MKPYLHVNKKGFISVYALVLLLIYSSFAIFLTAQVQTLYLYQKNTSLCDICILHTIHTKIKETGQEQVETDGKRENDLTNTDAQEERVDCDGINVHIQYEETQANASYVTKLGFVHMRIFYPEGFIERYEYE